MQMEQLQRKLKKLRREGLVLQLTFGKKRNAASQVLEDYAKFNCLELCERIYKICPREVRDMIYVHLHLGPEIFISPWSGHRGVAYFDSNSEAHYHKRRHLVQWLAGERVGG